MNKLQLFYIYKFDTARLKEYNYNINITPDEARKNGELVGVGDSQVLRTIRKITESEFSKEKLEILENEKRVIKKKKNSKENQDKLIKVQNDIDKLIHIPEYISIVVKSKEDYKKIIKNGVRINNINFVRLMCGAGHARKNTVIFCAEHIEKELKNILQNGMTNIEISHSKYNAYFALYSSATHVVSSPRVCVIPDKIIERKHLIDWVEESDRDIVYEDEKNLEFNFWDGMGIISPLYAKKWANELGINDYIPSAFTIRNAFIKGMVCTTRFHAFAKLVAKTKKAINDVWNKPIDNIFNYDMVLTESQFKLWKAFESWKSFETNCISNGITWGISRVSPKEEKNNTFTNYQFIQAIDLNSESIKSLCQSTVDWINDVCGMDIVKTLLFLSGNSLEDIVKDNTLDISKVKNDLVKAIILNNNVINDPYIKKSVYHLINKKIKEAYIGKLAVEGNFQVMISDPYAFCEHLFGLEVKGLLEDCQHYSNYWNKKNVDTVVAMRSPLTWRSEVNKLHLQNNSKINKWFKYLTSGIVYSVHGVDCMLAADSDYDYDIVMTTNSKEFVENCYGGLPITYKKNTTLKKLIKEEELYLSDLYSFNSEIGQVTNYSTSMYCMLADYNRDSAEYKELINRLKICRKEQGSQIDKAKGIVVKDFPLYWIKKQTVFENDIEEIKNKKEFENSLVITKKPYFMRWLYLNYNKKYTKYKNNADTYCEVNFGCDLEKLKNKDFLTDKEQVYLKEYKDYLPLNDSDCIMNLLCKYMESVKFNLSKFVNNSINFDYTILMDKSIIVTEDDQYNKILCLYNNFIEDKHLYQILKSYEKEGNKEKYDEEKYNSLQELYKYYKKELNKICSNESQLTNIVIDICYRKKKNYNKDFAWQLCSNGIINNLIINKQEVIYVPIKNLNGNIHYLFDNYNKQEVTLIEDLE